VLLRESRAMTSRNASLVPARLRAGLRAEYATVAGPDTSTIRSLWLAEGWKERVRAAVQSASHSFRGPLEFPDEPWHYVYEPTVERQAVTMSRSRDGAVPKSFETRTR
jgi:hypothetical protein